MLTELTLMAESLIKILVKLYQSGLISRTKLVHLLDFVVLLTKERFLTL